MSSLEDSSYFFLCNGKFKRTIERRHNFTKPRHISVDTTTQSLIYHGNLLTIFIVYVVILQFFPFICKFSQARNIVVNIYITIASNSGFPKVPDAVDAGGGGEPWRKRGEKG